MEKRLLLWALPLLILAMSASAHEECTSLTMHGILLDSDCDGVTNMYDNCPFTANAQQEDRNKDLIGDACDLLIQSVTIDPSVVVRASDFFGLNVQIINNQPNPLYEIQITVENTALDVDVGTSIPVIGAGSDYRTEFLLKVPRCTPAQHYPLRITTSYFNEGREHVETTTQTLKVANGGACEQPESLHENTLVDTFFEQELDVGETAIFPFRTLNMNEEAVTYHLRMEGLGTWGTYRLDPSTTFTLASGQETTSYLTIEMEHWAPLGEAQVWVVLSADGEEEWFPINLFIRDPVTSEQYEQLKQALEVTLILLILVLLIAGFIIAYRKANEDAKTNDDHNYLAEAGVDKVEGKR